MKMPAKPKELPKPVFRVSEKTEHMFITILNIIGIVMFAFTIAYLIHIW
jgi:hypothetical protein